MARMSALVLSLAWIFAGSFSSADEVPIQPDFDLTQFSGSWYPLQIVMDKGEMKNMEIVVRIVRPLQNGDISMFSKTFQNGKCTTNTMKLSHTIHQGEFLTKGGSVLKVVETDYKTYHIIHVETKKNKVLHLEVRKKNAPDSIKEKFKQLADSLGFPTDKIIDMPRTGSCD